MWQSRTWNGEDAAFRRFTIIGTAVGTTRNRNAALILRKQWTRCSPPAPQTSLSWGDPIGQHRDGSCMSRRLPWGAQWARTAQSGSPQLWSLSKLCSRSWLAGRLPWPALLFPTPYFRPTIRSSDRMGRSLCLFLPELGWVPMRSYPS
jgi:hypothetical protein